MDISHQLMDICFHLRQVLVTQTVETDTSYRILFFLGSFQSLLKHLMLIRY